jgi:hypothetical protein
MGQERKTARQWLSAVLLSLAFLPLPWSCQQRQATQAPPPPPPPPPPNYFEIGETAFHAGDYPRAVESFGTYLSKTPEGPDADRAHFRLALVYALPSSTEHNTARASELLQELILNYPRSAFAGAATLLLRQQVELQQQRSEAERLRGDINRQEAQIQALARELDEAKQVEQAALEQLRTDLTRREERIRQLSGELERLKQIDLQRRPTTTLP